MPQLGRSAGVSGFVDLARELGLDGHALAAAVGLPRDVFTRPDLRVSVELMCRMLEMAAELSGAEDVALRLAERRRISHMGTVGLVVREQPDLRAAISAYARYQWLQNDAYALALEEFGDQAILRIHGPPWQQRQAQDLAVATTVRLLKSVVGDAWKPLEVRFTHAAPARMDTYRRLLGVTPLFDQDGMAIVMRRADLNVALPAADPEMTRGLTRYLDKMTEDRRLQWRDRVADLVVALLPDGVCSVERVARQLGTDRRTLHRRLAAEGTTFSEILDATRRDMAASLLVNSDRPLQGVADILGFSSLSAFAHWFRRRFGQSASSYRSLHSGAPPGPQAAVGSSTAPASRRT